MLRKFAQNILHKLFYLFAAALVLLAVLITSVRMLTPVLNYQHKLCAAWVEHLLGRPIKIGHLEAWWDGYHPELRLKDVTIFSADHKKIILHINKLFVDINLLHSLLKRNLQPGRIIISGIEFNLFQTNTRHLKFTPIQQQILDWLFTHSQVLLHQVRINWYVKQQESYEFLLHNLAFVASGKKYTVSVTGNLLDSANTVKSQIALHLDFKVEPQATTHYLPLFLYLNLHNFPAHILGQYLQFANYKIKPANVTGQFWCKWLNSRLNSVQALVNLQQLKLIPDKASDITAVAVDVSGNFLWHMLTAESGWKLTADHISWQQRKKMLTAKSTIVNSKLLLINNARVPQFFWANYLPLQEVVNLVPKLSVELQHINLRGEMKNVTIWNQQANVSNPGAKLALGNYLLKAKVANVTTKAWRHFPAVNNLSGTVFVNPDGGRFAITSHKLAVQFNKIFLQPLMFASAVGTVVWRYKNNHNMQLALHKVKLCNQHLSLGIDGDMYFSTAKHFDPDVNLFAKVSLNDSSLIKNYLPLGLMSDAMRSWFMQAFPEGAGANATIVMRGRPSEIPFARKLKNIFAINANINNTTIKYASAWPRLANINANLQLQHGQLNCTVKSGRVGNVNITSLRAIIPSFVVNPAVTVKLQAHGYGKDILKYINSSPLNTSIGANLKQILLTGVANLQLNLHVPFNSASIKTSGVITFTKNTLQIPNWNIALHNLSGELCFQQDKFWANNLQAELFGAPIKFTLHSFATSQQADNSSAYAVQVKFVGIMPIFALKQYFAVPELNFFQGSSNYSGTLDVYFGLLPNKLSLTSDLSGVQINLPSPWGKAATQLEPFSLTAQFSDRLPPIITAALDDTLSAVLQYKFTPDGVAFAAGNIHLGAGHAVKQSMPGLYIDGELPKFLWSVWRKYFDMGVGMKDYSWLREIKLKLGTIKMFQCNFFNSVISLKPLANFWRLNILSAQVAGNIAIPFAFPHQKLQIDLQKLVVPSSLLQNKGISQFNPQNIPPLNATIDNFYYGDKYFGKILLRAYPLNNALQISKLMLSSPLFLVKLQGSWSKAKSGMDKSHLYGTLASDNLAQMLHVLKIHSSVIAHKVNVQFNLSWAKMLFSPDVKTMLGDLKFELGRGRIVDLGTQANQKLNLGSLLTLLNINRLVKFNFSDLVHKGYSFNTLSGDFYLNNGQVTVNNLFFDGPVARINILGTASLITKKLDLKLAVTPYITSSVPIVAGIIGGPVAGVVAFVANKMFGRFVDNLTTYHYLVSGLWTQPRLKRVLG